MQIHLDVAMLIYNLIEYSDDYSKTYWSIYQLCRNEPNNTINDSDSFKSKPRFFDNTENAVLRMRK